MFCFYMQKYELSNSKNLLIRILNERKGQVVRRIAPMSRTIIHIFLFPKENEGESAYFATHEVH